MLRALRTRLTVRLGLGLCLATGAILIAAGAWNLSLQRAHLTSLVELSATERADVIRSSTREAMMRNDPGDVLRIIEDIARQPTIERIRVLDKRGHIRVSSQSEEVGSLVDTTAEQCVSCHLPDQTLERLEQQERARIFVNPNGDRVLGVIAPIPNEPGCAEAACHAHTASQTILGVLDVQLSLAGVDEDLAASERQLMIGLIGTALGVLVLAWLLVWRMVLKPVRSLDRAASRVAAGDLTTRVSISSEDEIGQMTMTWNSMVGELDRARKELERWGQTLEKKVKEKTNELEEAHRRMLLVEKMASLGKLATVMAHEINNPLTGISTYAHLLRKKLLPNPAEEPAKEGSADGETIQALELIESEARRCGHIVRNLLLFSRMPEARFDDERLGPLLERCIFLLQHQADAKEVELTLEVSTDFPVVECDSSQIQQMVLALAMNGIEATPPGGTVIIRAVPSEGENSILLEVADTGRGIPPDHLDQIVEPFFTTKDKADGVGLGLAVVYGIVNRHHGRIEVDSNPGSGTAFLVRLPIRQPTQDAALGESVDRVTS
jgi:two-component system NtrC family sensor kinase